MFLSGWHIREKYWKNLYFQKSYLEFLLFKNWICSRTSQIFGNLIIFGQNFPNNLLKTENWIKLGLKSRNFFWENGKIFEIFGQNFPNFEKTDKF